MMAVGKSTIGRAIAAATGWPYVDNDELLARAEGRSTATVLEVEGEAALRLAESAALDFALSLDPPVVAGVAAGVITDPDARRRMQGDDAFVVHLRAPIELLAERVIADEARAAAAGRPGRPWVGDDPAAALAELHQGRAALYLEVADLVVDVVGRTPADMAAEIVSAVAADRSQLG